MMGGWIPQRYTQNHKKETYEKQEQATKVESTCRIVGESQRNVGDFRKNVGDFSKNVGDISQKVRDFFEKRIVNFFPI